MPSPLLPAGDPDHEIERKWLVAGAPPPLTDGIELQQGYLSDGSGGEVRVRRAGHLHTLTAKRGRGLVRQEVELSLTAAQFTALWPLTRGRRIHKTRYAISDGEHTIELDVYHGILDGLRTAEVEFAGVAEAAAYRPPDWFGAELTGEPGGSNGDLARQGRPG
jgi:CYTH domain-containing protein